MHSIFIEGTDKTPTIRFEPKQGKLEIRGSSIPEHSLRFYAPLIEELMSYANNPAATTQVDIDMGYFNTSSSRYLLDILKLLAKVKEKGNELTITWFYEEGDEDMREVGKELQYVTGLTFTMSPVKTS